MNTGDSKQVLYRFLLIWLCLVILSCPSWSSAQEYCHGGGNYTDLYLSDSDVPEAFYDHLYLGNEDTLFVGEDSAHFADPYIVGIKILPPDAVTGAEEYLPQEHYSVDLHVDGTATAYFCRSGVYAVKVLWEPDSSRTYFVFVNAGQLGKKKAKDSPCQEIETPEADVIIVEAPGANNGAAFDDYAAAAYDGEVRVSTVQQAIDEINNRYNALGRKVSVIIHGHGAPGDQSVGEGSKGTNNAGETLKDNNDKVQTFCDQLKGKISELKLMGCQVGRDTPGENLLKTLSRGLKDNDGITPSVSAYDRVVYSRALSLFGFVFRARIGVDKGASLVSKYVDLSSFAAIAHGDRITIEWTTAIEIDNAGFNLYRRAANEHEKRWLNAQLIAAKGDELKGASYSFIDTDVPENLTYYWLEDVDLHGKTTMHGPVSVAAASVIDMPSAFMLAQSRPNPFIVTTEITYGLPEACEVNLSIFDVMGKKVATLVKGHQAAGYKVVHWDGTDEKGKPVSDGIYFYRLEAEGHRVINKMILLR